MPVNLRGAAGVPKITDPWASTPMMVVELADLTKEPRDTGQGSTRRYREEKRVHTTVHLTVDFRASAQVVNVRVCGIRVLIGPDALVRTLAQFSHPFQSGKEVSAILVRLVHHLNMGAQRLHLGYIFLCRLWIDHRNKRIPFNLQRKLRATPDCRCHSTPTDLWHRRPWASNTCVRA